MLSKSESPMDLSELELGASTDDLIKYFLEYHKIQSDIAEANSIIEKKRHATIVILTSLTIFLSLGLGVLAHLYSDQSEKLFLQDLQTKVLNIKLDRLLHSQFYQQN